MLKRNFLVRCFVIAFICQLSLHHSYSQIEANIPTVLPPSPNAASLGVYGQIPVSLFSGLPQISIPLGEVKAGNISLPISLNYHGGGIRPDHHPGWAGLGWDISAGGVITRKVNGISDEYYWGQTPHDKYAYFYNYQKADNNLWASTDTLLNYMNSSNYEYPAPDEFQFNFGKFSGSFYFNHKGQWQVRSADPINLKVKEEILLDYNLVKQTGARSNKGIKRIFYKFTLITPDGCKYVFGGTQTSVEFTRPGGNGAPDSEGSDIVATAWYLTNVVTRDGHVITLTYNRGEGAESIQALLASNLLRYDYTTNSPQSEGDMSHRSVVIINPSYLSSIT